MTSHSGPETGVTHPHGHLRRDVLDGEEALERFERGERHRGHASLLDPLMCQMAAQQGLAPTLTTGVNPTQAAPAALPIREDLQNLLNGIARRVAWGGDRRRGSARIEVGEGALAGATLVVHTEQRSVSVELELPAGAAGQGLRERLLARLEARGFAAQVKVG